MNFEWPAWVERAACAGKPSEWFHPEEGSRKGQLPPIARRALALCATCPVSDECLAHTIMNEEFTFTVRAEGEQGEEVRHWLVGILAGTTLKDRKATRHLDAEERFKVLKARAQRRYRENGLVEGGPFQGAWPRRTD
jgi:hypothetical protein